MVVTAVGVAVLVLVVHDVVTTSVSLRPRGGPLTARLSVWVRSVPRRRRNDSHEGGGVRTGPRVLLATVSAWVLLSWIGWSLVFLGGPSAVVDASTGTPAGVAARVYFAGFSVFTLGIGDFRPHGALWQVATAVAAAQGFFVLTFSVAYVLPVVSAATERRAAARAIASLGRTPAAMVVNAWNGERFGNLQPTFAHLRPMLTAVQEKHHAYPVLHDFVSLEADASLPRCLAVLSEALLLWSAGVAPDRRPDAILLRDLERVVEGYLDMLAQTHIRIAAEAPAPPSLQLLQEMGIPTVSPAEFHRSAASFERRRRLLLGLVEGEARRWSDVDRGTRCKDPT